MFCLLNTRLCVMTSGTGINTVDCLPHPRPSFSSEAVWDQIIRSADFLTGYCVAYPRRMPRGHDVPSSRNHTTHQSITRLDWSNCSRPSQDRFASLLSGRFGAALLGGGGMFGGRKLTHRLLALAMTPSGIVEMLIPHRDWTQRKALPHATIHPPSAPKTPCRRT